MIHCVVINDPAISVAHNAGVEAVWISQHVTNGVVGTGNDPIAALRDLADNLEAAELRRMELPE